MMAQTFSILIVDDDKDNAESLGELFELEGHRITIALSGDEALKVHRSENFDITFMDVMMPGKNGVQTFKELKELRPSAKVVMMTGYSVEQFLRQALEHGAVGIMAKPFDPQAVLSLIEELGPRSVIVAPGAGQSEGRRLKELLETQGRGSHLVEDIESNNQPQMANSNDVLIVDSPELLIESIGYYFGMKKVGHSGSVVIVTQSSEPNKTAGSYLADFCATGILVKPFDPENVVDRLDLVAA